MTVRNFIVVFKDKDRDDFIVESFSGFSFKNGWLFFHDHQGVIQHMFAEDAVQSAFVSTKGSK